MSEGNPLLAATDDDITKLLLANAHIGTKNVNFQMAPYVFKRKSDGTHLINLHKTYEKILLAARAIAAIENHKEVAVVSGRPVGQRAVLKYGAHTGASPLAGRYTPGTFTNQIQKAFQEPRLLVVTDVRVDHQAVKESSYVNLPVIALANTDSALRYVDIAIPVNNAAVNSVGLVWWLLAREVLRLRGTLNRTEQWSIMPDLYFYRDLEAEIKTAHAKEEEEAAAAPAGEEWSAAAPAAASGEEWNAAAPTDWSGANWA